MMTKISHLNPKANQVQKIRKLKLKMVNMIMSNMKLSKKTNMMISKMTIRVNQKISKVSLRVQTFW